MACPLRLRLRDMILTITRGHDVCTDAWNVAGFADASTSSLNPSYLQSPTSGPLIARLPLLSR